jgi:hypothetical protein
VRPIEDTMNTSPSVNPAPTKLPRQVVRASKRADELLKQRAEAADSPAPAEPPAPEPGVQAQPVPSPAPAPAPAPAVDPRDTDPAYWKQRFQVTEGMFRRQRDQHATELAARDARIVELEGEVARLKSAQHSDAGPALNVSEFLTPEQIDQLGEDQSRAIVATALKAAQREVRDTVNKELAPLREREKLSSQDEARRKRAAFDDGLTDAVPEWREIDQNPLWLAWLTHEDEATGMVRQALIDSASKILNPKPIIRLLNEFLAKQDAARVPTAPPAVPADTGGAGSGGPPAPPAEKLLTRAEVREHYKLRALGKIKDDEARKFDARLKAMEAAGVSPR